MKLSWNMKSQEKGLKWIELKSCHSQSSYSQMREGYQSFLGHTNFYRRFVKDFSKITRLLTNLLSKNVSFTFDNKCINFWEKLKKELIFTPIISAPEWSKSFEIMCDASDFFVGVVLRKRIDNKQHMIYYSNRDLNDAQLNYTTNEKNS